jgi:hypothetical protein
VVLPDRIELSSRPLVLYRSSDQGEWISSELRRATPLWSGALDAVIAVLSFIVIQHDWRADECLKGCGLDGNSRLEPRSPVNSS